MKKERRAKKVQKKKDAQLPILLLTHTHTANMEREKTKSWELGAAPYSEKEKEGKK